MCYGGFNKPPWHNFSFPHYRAELFRLGESPAKASERERVNPAETVRHINLLSICQRWQLVYRLEARDIPQCPAPLLLVSVVTSISQMSHDDWMNGSITQQNVLKSTPLRDDSDEQLIYTQILETHRKYNTHLVILQHMQYILFNPFFLFFISFFFVLL